jgi:ABC-2 type transport system ATP-binding protein
MSDWAIECQGLTKEFARTRAVWDLTLRVPRGGVYGLLGRNGCGKTTTIKLLLGLLAPTRGSCRVMGHDSLTMPEEVRERVGYLIEGHPLYRTWTVRRLADFTRALYRRWDGALFDETLRQFEIDPRSWVWSLSRGQRGMVALALVLATSPEVLILDDPALGLDAVARRRFLETMVKVIQSEGRTILFASHHLGDVERVADRIAVLDRGVLRVDCPTEEFIERVRRVELEGEAGKLENFPGLLDVEQRGSRVSLTLVNLDDEKRDRLRALAPSGFEEVPLNLEDAFIAYTGSRALRPAKGD